MKLHLVCDTSGSMADAGKAFIMRTVSMTINQWIRLSQVEVDLKLYSWAENLESFPTWNLTDDFPDELLSCKGDSSMETLIKGIGSEPNGKVLILTDGYWGRVSERRLKRWKDGLPSNTVNFIKIGADANPQLKGDNVFVADDWIAALEAVAGGVNK